jgi:hypothetical protein
MYEVAIEGSTIINNYGSYNGIYIIKGVMRLQILNTYFENNGDSYDELLTLLGTLTPTTASPSTSTLGKLLTTNAQTIEVNKFLMFLF